MDPSIACSLSAPRRAERERNIRALFAGAARREELPEGLALRFDGDAAWLGRIAELAARERECCRFLRFEMDAEPDLGPIHLRVTGPEGTGAFLAGWADEG